MRRIIFIGLALCALLALPAAAEGALFPPLADPVDQYMQRLAVMSQQDELVRALPYNGDTVENRGCGPVAAANPLIAALGVTDKEDAAQLVYEVMAVLTPKRQYRRKPIAIERMTRVLHQQDRAASTEDFPQLAQRVGHYPGEIISGNDDLTAAYVSRIIEDSGGGSLPLLAGRMYVQDSWEETVRILYALHDARLDDALVCLGFGGAGTAATGAPLRTSGKGHYLGACIHVGTFIRTGAAYILDSLPRALAGEPFGPAYTCHVAYRFLEDDPASPFNSTFAPSRISPTVIKLSLQPDQLGALNALQQQAFASPEEKAEALIALHTRQLAPLKLFGRCTMLVSLQEISYN